MIVDWILDWFVTALNWLVGLFPEDTALGWVSYVETVLDNLGALNYFLPIAETFALVVGVFALFPVFLGVTLSLWVVAQLRGSSSNG